MDGILFFDSNDSRIPYESNKLIWDTLRINIRYMVIKLHSEQKNYSMWYH